jgi:D-alanyl-D-alanine carboxypeptidase/D-alanyl-D-alanine-endopeptidase (penicillin-binding protein 4)
VAIVVVVVAVTALRSQTGHQPGDAVASTGGAVVGETSHLAKLRPVDHPRPVARIPPVAHMQPVLTPALEELRGALTRQLGAAGPDSGAEVYDLGAHAQLFGARAQVKRPPASVEKLYTTVALLRKLGPGARLTTTVLGTGSLGPGGVWQGDLYLRGGGDPTLGDATFNRIWESGYGPTIGQLATQLIKHGIRRVTGVVIGDASLFDGLRGGPATAYAPDVPDFGGELSALSFDHGSSAKGLSPGAFAARELVLTLRASHVIVRAVKRTATTPPGARVLARVSSPPMSVLLSLMDVPSDDLFAELLTKQLGSRFDHAGTIAAGAHVITGVIHSYALHPTIVDGSGLSRKDRSSPLEVSDLLAEVWHTPVGLRLSGSLPVVGETGTVRFIATRTAAQGHCIAKTGTLDYVTNLAGYCAARGHHMVAFALFLDGPTNEQALVLLGRMVAAIAKYCTACAGTRAAATMMSWSWVPL